MILGLWLDQPLWLMFGTVALLFGAVSALLCALTWAAPTRPLMQWLGTGLVPTYFTAISMLLALMTGFVANDAWERQRQAAKVVQTERANALAIRDLSLATVSDMAPIRKALSDYLEGVVGDEWARMREGASSPAAGAALGRLLQTVSDPRIGTEGGAAAHAALLDAAMALRAARGERLALSDAQGDETKWLTLLVLAGLTLVAIALVHLDRPGAQATALTLFSVAVVTTLGLIAVHERPFDGPLALSPEPLRIARAGIPPQP
ncbi:DUF4239 domain-containing protein [Methylobacterium dankookense]|uniref:DUF4239 domain-containing protein n=1 Tax=Methylobacterium dankookense TaxID=560405 RepID=A0A564G4N1_9HYPH|nr:DUF4239 domain-containing protein [Methylobacterium dankookense]GJD56795.1 hypothetical protein IFDJLNFL_2692 [Methylobacterium dankookense]VUF15004.1 hypothetical protein MTDSW087_04732 [Methylobacterium dankookense]